MMHTEEYPRYFFEEANVEEFTASFDQHRAEWLIIPA